MPEAVERLDWGRTPLGPRSAWPASLSAAVSICLHSHFPMLVLWGPQMVLLYNDAYVPVLGDKHPQALGQPLAQVWSEVWPTIGPMLHAVMRSGVATRGDDRQLSLLRHGFLEECYFTSSYSPIRAEGGAIGGVFIAVLETTERVVNERRLKALSAFGARLPLARDRPHALQLIQQVLASDPHSFPLAALYLVDEARTQLLPAVFAGWRGNPPAAVRRPLPLATDPHAVAAVVRRGRAAVVDFDEVVPAGTLCGVWPEPPRQALLLPLLQPGQPQSRPGGALLLAADPRRPLDAEYRSFFDSVAGQVTAALANIDAVARTAAGRRLKKPVVPLREDRPELASGMLQAIRADEANELLAATFDRAPGGIAILDAGGRYLRTNAALQALLGRSEEELEGQHSEAVTWHEDWRHKRALMARLLQGEIQSFAMELRYLRPDGSLLWVSNFVSTLRRRDGACCFVSISQDISDRKKAEEQRSASQQELHRLYDRLQSVREEERLALAREVHDQLGQLLSAAKIDVKLLEDDLRASSAPPSRRKLLAELRSARQTMDQAIDSVREVATRLRPPQLDEHGLCAAIRWHARDFERRTRMRFAVDITPGLREPGGAVATALFRIYQEAVTNVLRHAHASRVAVSLVMRGRAIVLRVCDDGIGISRQQARSSRSLGITGMRERAAVCRGQLRIAALRGRGTLLAVRMPAEGA